MKNQINEIGNEVIDLQIKALKKLKSSINPSFNDAVKTITNCKSKVILCLLVLNVANNSSRSERKILSDGLSNFVIVIPPYLTKCIVWHCK